MKTVYKYSHWVIYNSSFVKQTTQWLIATTIIDVFSLQFDNYNMFEEF